MNFKKGDLAVIVDGPWKEAIGRVVRVIWKCRESYGKGVSADGLVQPPVLRFTDFTILDRLLMDTVLAGEARQ